MGPLKKRARPGVAGTTAEVPTALPNLVVIGAQKCGTTALNHYLELHPEIAMSKPNELNYFIERRNWSRGIDWYQRHFDPATPVRGDQSPNYTIYPHDPGVPERMHEVIPDAKLIYMIRDPLKRIGAHWVHNYAKYRERGTAAETIMHAYTTYLIRSMYFMQLQRFLKHYDRSRVLVVEQDDLRDRRLETLRGIFDFLGVDPEFDHPDFRRLRHVTARKKRQTRLGMFAQRVRPGASLDPNLRPARVAAGGPRSRGAAVELPGVLWSPLDKGVKAWGKLQRPIERPDIGEILDPEVLSVLRDDARGLQQLTGRSFEHWTIWT